MQGMMMSERPASIATGMVDSSVSIGNYKGVMLCNRPFAGAAGGAAAAASGGGGGAAANTFSCGTVPESLGLNRKLEIREMKRTKKDTALSRHRKWLADLQRTKVALDQEQAKDAEAKAEARRKFNESQAKMRAQVRGVSSTGEAMSENPQQESKMLDTSTFTADKSEAKQTAMALNISSVNQNDRTTYGNNGPEHSDAKAEAKEATAPAVGGGGAGDEQKSTGAVDVATVAARRAKMKGQATLPAWALTESKAQDVAAEAEEEELDDLLDFAKNLDFDKYIGDVEIATMMEQVSKRISELEALSTDDDVEQYERRMANRGGNRNGSQLTAARVAALQAKYGVEPSPQDDDDDDETRSVAASMLSEHKDLGNIHSKKSIGALAATAASKLNTARGGGGGADPSSSCSSANPSGGEAKLEPPAVVKHPVDQGTRISNKSTVQNLPYMHRNPAV